MALFFNLRVISFFNGFNGKITPEILLRKNYRGSCPGYLSPDSHIHFAGNSFRITEVEPRNGSALIKTEGMLLVANFVEPKKR